MELNDLHQAPANAEVNPTPAPEAATDAAAAPAAEAPATDPSSDDIIVAEALADAVENTDESESREPMSRAEVMTRLSELAKQPATEISSEEVARLKQLFYQGHNDMLATARQAFIDAGNDPETFVPDIDPDEDTAKALLNEIKEKKAVLRAEQEAQREANLNRKQSIIDELMSMGSDTDNVNRHYPRAKDLQAEFKAVGEVPASKAAEIWKKYQEAVEHFYDQWKVNKELRDYDFKKNLSEKQLLIDEASRLVDESDVVTAFKRLQDLHDKWREIGPVAKEIREETWARFKDVSASINKRYQAFFEERKASERANELAKIELCNQAEAIEFTTASTYAAWEAITKHVLDLQAQWKTIGFASRKVNTALFNRFRTACDRLFAAKAAFYKTMKDELADNLSRKTALCERAEELKDSTDWRKTTDELVKIQKEWKTIGPVAKRHSDAIWRRFQTACDAFFDRKKKEVTDTRSEERANLKAKREILESLRALNADDCATPRAEAVNAVKELRAKWQSIGFVPFREKDKLQEAYRTVVGELFDKLDLNENRQRFQRHDHAGSARAENNGNNRERLARTLEQRRSELQTYENNMGFLSAKSKSGNAMLREMELKMQGLRDEIEELRKKIADLDSQN
ncbi:MAG: DUF349 domain-containing protein [Bacteroides sp.]|nr:DUF349 domain-containing protein [Bacteroides sp.]